MSTGEQHGGVAYEQTLFSLLDYGAIFRLTAFEFREDDIGKSTPFTCIRRK